MKTILIVALTLSMQLGPAAILVCGQTIYQEYRSSMAGLSRECVADTLPGAAPLVGASQYTTEDWAELIDATWGAGLPTADKLQLFDAAWQALDSGYGAFMNLDVDLQAFRDLYRPEIEGGVSRGRFAAIMNHLSFALKDAHTVLMSRSVNWGTTMRPGVPLLVIGAWLDTSYFGASLTPLPDGNLLVIRALPNHRLGLEAGDIVVGYDGVPWKDLYPQLLQAQLPIRLAWTWGSTDEAMTHSLLMSAGLNWHLFETIDIIKYDGEELHLPTSLLTTQYGLIWGNEQLPVAGVPMPDFWAEDYISWGIVEGTQIGYIYVTSWSWYEEDRISEQFYEAIYSLMHDYQTTGMIIDYRLNTGGYMLMAHDGYSLLFNSPVTKVAFDVRGEPDDHLDMVPHPTFTAQLFTIPGDPETYYDRPIAVLTGPGAVSNGDWESLRTPFHPRVRTFGKPSNGAFTSSDTPYLGSGWYFSRATGSGYLLDGHRYLAHTGAPVDEEIWLTQEDVAQGRDTVVEAAIRWINSHYPRRAGRRASFSD